MERRRRSSVNVQPPLVILLCTFLLLSLACGSITRSEPTSPSQTPEIRQAIGLPATWTTEPSQTPKPSKSPVPPLTETSTQIPVTSSPSSSPTVSATATNTPDLNTPVGVVEAAFAAYLQIDEHQLETLLDEQAQEMCRAISGSILKCISSGYQRSNLKGLESWWVVRLGGIDPSSDVDFVSVRSRWANSEKVWSHIFSLNRITGKWLISEVDLNIFPLE